MISTCYCIIFFRENERDRRANRQRNYHIDRQRQRQIDKQIDRRMQVEWLYLSWIRNKNGHEYYEKTKKFPLMPRNTNLHGVRPNGIENNDRNDHIIIIKKNIQVIYIINTYMNRDKK